jgi:hypothetical protein
MFERRDLGQGMRGVVSTGLESSGVLAVFTERSGGGSRGPYASLNLGGRGDDRARIVANRRQLAGALGLEAFACPEQVHGATVAAVGADRAAAGFDGSVPMVRGADGLVTSSPGVAMAVFGADCPLVALADPATGTVAAVHAGWRGIAAGVIGEAVAAFDNPARVRAAVGPSVGADHYAVGEDVARAVSEASEGGAVTRRSGPTLSLDLPATIARMLRELGVRHVDVAEACTACEEGRFFSVRRDGETGRQALIAGALALG